MAPQPLIDAERDVRSVVATALMLGKAATTLVIIARNAAVGSDLKFASTSSSSKPSAAEKSSSLPNNTSTNGISDRLTLRACTLPPTERQSESRKLRSYDTQV